MTVNNRQSLTEERYRKADAAFADADLQDIEVVGTGGWETDGEDRMVMKAYLDVGQKNSHAMSFTVEFTPGTAELACDPDFDLPEVESATCFAQSRNVLQLSRRSGGDLVKADGQGDWQITWLRPDVGLIQDLTRFEIADPQDDVQAVARFFTVMRDLSVPGEILTADLAMTSASPMGFTDGLTQAIHDATPDGEDPDARDDDWDNHQWSSLREAMVDNCPEYSDGAFEPRIFGYYINLDERGEFYADIRNKIGMTVFAIRTDGSDEDLLGPDGVMRHKDDIDQLRKTLISQQVIGIDDELLGMVEFEAKLETLMAVPAGPEL